MSKKDKPKINLEDEQLISKLKEDLDSARRDYQNVANTLVKIQGIIDYLEHKISVLEGGS